MRAQEQLQEQYRDKLDVEPVCRGFLETAKDALARAIKVHARARTRQACMHAPLTRLQSQSYLGCAYVAQAWNASPLGAT